MKRYMTPKTRAFKGGSVDDDPREVMEEIRVTDEMMERIERHMEGQTKTKTLQEVMREIGIEDESHG